MENIEVTLYLQRSWAEALRRFAVQFPLPQDTGEKHVLGNRLLCGIRELADAIDEAFAGPTTNVEEELLPIPVP